MNILAHNVNFVKCHLLYHSTFQTEKNYYGISLKPEHFTMMTINTLKINIYFLHRISVKFCFHHREQKSTLMQSVT